ncbi:hypothetical protein PFISCL1PPCAC_19982, partial [Pristionchus fissidentatus]
EERLQDQLDYRRREFYQRVEELTKRFEYSRKHVKDLGALESAIDTICEGIHALPPIDNRGRMAGSKPIRDKRVFQIPQIGKPGRKRLAIDDGQSRPISRIAKSNIQVCMKCL